MPNNKIILKKLTILDTIWHPETKLVFKSRSEKIVTGMYVDNEFVHLDDTAIELCEKWGFIMDESLFETVDENTNNVIEEVTNVVEPEIGLVNEDIVETNNKQDKEDIGVVHVNEEIVETIESDKEEIGVKSTQEEINNVQEEVVTNNLETLDSKLCCVVKTLSEVISQIKQAHDLELSNSKNEILKLKEALLRMTDERDKLESKFSVLKGLLG